MRKVGRNAPCPCGSVADVAISLRHAGYIILDGFRVIDDEPMVEV